MKIIRQVYKIKAPVEKVWEAFVNPREIEKWGGGSAKMEGKAGFKFSLWGGEIFGVNTKVVKNKLLEQDWYGGKWEAPSKVKFEFTYKDNVTSVVLMHSAMPASETDNLADGWKDYYMGPMKEYLEN